jgi:lactate dehydrogenase-like 2-hydroxyacid dehydrogenase
MDILFLDNPTLPLNTLLEQNNCRVFKPGKENPLTIECIYTHMTRFVKDDYPRLKYVLCPMTGVMHLGDTTRYDLYYLDDKQWLYDNVWSTAEHTFSLMIRLMRGLNREIRNKVIGIVGFGRVGQQLYKLLEGWNVNVLWFDTKEHQYDLISTSGKMKYLDDIFLESDVISIHLPENSLTRDMINQKYFDLCTKQPIILNTARASVMNYIDMLAAFDNGKLAGFGLDVDINWIKQNQGSAWKMLESLASIYRGAIITDHVAGKSIDSRIATDKFVFNKLFKDLGGKLYETDIGLL